METYPCYVRIGESASAEDIVELPTEADGTLLLSTLTSQFPDAIGLRYKSESGAWRGVRVTSGVLDVPLEGWGNKEYYVTTISKAGVKRNADEDSAPKNRNKKETPDDLIVLGLPYSATEADMKEYFSKFGELAHWEVKMDKQTNKSKGYGFVRFLDVEAVEKVLNTTHSIGGRKCEVQFPTKKPQPLSLSVPQDGIPTKLYIGLLPRGATLEDLKDCFSKYGPLKDLYIPKRSPGFGFVTFPSEMAAYTALSATHKIRGCTLNVTLPNPKQTIKEAKRRQKQMQQLQMRQQRMQQQVMQQQNNGYNTMTLGGGMHMQANMQGNMASNMPGNVQQQMPIQQDGLHGSQPQSKGNTGYYTQGYFQSGGQVQGGGPV